MTTILTLIALVSLTAATLVVAINLPTTVCTLQGDLQGKYRCCINRQDQATLVVKDEYGICKLPVCHQKPLESVCHGYKAEYVQFHPGPPLLRHISGG